MSVVRGAACPLASASCGEAATDEWSRWTIAARLKVLKRARGLLAERAEDLAASISPELARTKADTLAAEVWPLLDACKFLEREAATILQTRKVGARGRPLWLSGVTAEVRREPLGHVVVIGPANFPLFLPGVQVLQAVAAGNRVTWKPGAGGGGVASMVQRALVEAGLPAQTLVVTEETAEAGLAALAQRPDKVVLTGAHETGVAVLHALAGSATPAVMELSGCDAVFVLPGADLAHAAKAVAYGLRLNGGAVCMSPRRLFAQRSTIDALLPLLQQELAAAAPVQLAEATFAKLRSLTEQAVAAGAQLVGEVEQPLRPLVLRNVQPAMAIANADVFAPVVSLTECGSILEALHACAECDYALTASVFCGRGEMQVAEKLATEVKAGVVLINDVIAPTADPRLPFGGRGASGFGVTRGAEGLLEMTAVKTVIVRRGGRARHLEPEAEQQAQLLGALIRSAHANRWSVRWQGIKDVMKFGRGAR